jgi:tetratricopeptide (TPR) repeat protein
VKIIFRWWFIGLAVLSLLAIGCQRKESPPKESKGAESRPAPDSLVVEASILLNRGVEYYNSGYYLKAIELYRQSLSTVGDFPEAYYNMGLAFRKLNQIDSSIAAYGRALALKGDYPQALNNLAFIYLQYRPDLNQALPLAERAVMLKPLNPDFLDTYARILFSLGQVDSACVVLEKAIFLAEDPTEMELRLAVYKSAKHRN